MLSSVVRHPVRHVEHKLPERVLDVARRREPLSEVDRATLSLEPIEDAKELPMGFQLGLLFVFFLTPLLDEHVGLVVTVEAPVVLVEAPDRHYAAVIYLDGLHMQVLEGLLGHLGSVFAQSIEQVRVEE